MESLTGERTMNNGVQLMITSYHRYSKQNRPKPKKVKDIEKRQLIQPYKSSLQDLSIDVQSLKRS